MQIIVELDLFIFKYQIMDYFSQNCYSEDILQLCADAGIYSSFTCGASCSLSQTEYQTY